MTTLKNTTMLFVIAIVASFAPAAKAATLITEDFNGFTAPAGNFNGGQF